MAAGAGGGQAAPGSRPHDPGRHWPPRPAPAQDRTNRAQEPNRQDPGPRRWRPPPNQIGKHKGVASCHTLYFPLARSVSLYKIYLCTQKLRYVSVTPYYLIIIITKFILFLNKKYLKISFNNYDETNKLKWNILISW